MHRETLLTRYSLQSPSTDHCSNSLFCCSTMYSGDGSFYRIRIVQSFVKTISEQSLVRGGVARLRHGEIFYVKCAYSGKRYWLCIYQITLNLSLLKMTLITSESLKIQSTIVWCCNIKDCAYTWETQSNKKLTSQHCYVSRGFRSKVREEVLMKDECESGKNFPQCLI